MTSLPSTDLTDGEIRKLITHFDLEQILNALDHEADAALSADDPQTAEGCTALWHRIISVYAADGITALEGVAET